jgi:GNAT superfamily N-acetyltransferase
MQISGPQSFPASQAETILRALPAWFGREDALLRYAQDAQDLPTLVAREGEGPVAFLTMRQHFKESAEISCIAVLPQWHRRGVGAALLRTAEQWAAAQGALLLQVKTLGTQANDTNYEKSRQFYLASRFVPLEENLEIWDGTPCLILVKILNAFR